MGATRIQTKSRTAKKVMVEADYSTGSGSVSYTKIVARKPKFDKRGYPAYKGLPAPVLVGITVVA